MFRAYFSISFVHQLTNALSVFTTTWNLGSQYYIEEASLDQWLMHDKNGLPLSYKPDVYSIGTQETGLSANVLPFISVVPVHHWITTLRNYFARRDYVLVGEESVGVTVLLVFVKRSISGKIKYEGVETLSLGHLSHFGDGYHNKGGITIGITYQGNYREIPLLFINVHLPHGEEPAQRNERHVRFKQVTDMFARCRGSSMRGTSSSCSSIPQCEMVRVAFPFPMRKCQLRSGTIVFLFGDTNVRLQFDDEDHVKTTSGVRRDQAVSILGYDPHLYHTVPGAPEYMQYDPQRWTSIIDYFKNADEAKQLLHEGRSEWNALTGFGEMPINFGFSYRRDPEGGERKISTKRFPAWTDRVFFKPRNDHKLILFGYYNKYIIGSDHLPVILEASLVEW